MRGRLGGTDSEGFTFVTGSPARRQAGRRRNKGRNGAQAAAAAAREADTPELVEIEAVERELARVHCRLRDSSFCASLLRLAAFRTPFRHASCLGLGSPATSSPSRWQLSCLVSLLQQQAPACRGIADWTKPPVSEAAACSLDASTPCSCVVVDPLCLDADIALLKNADLELVGGDLGVTLPIAATAAHTGPKEPVQEQWDKVLGRAHWASDGSELLFMPHCPGELYEAALRQIGQEAINGCNLEHIVLIGNALSMYQGREGGALFPCLDALLITGTLPGDKAVYGVREQRVDATGAVSERWLGAGRPGSSDEGGDSASHAAPSSSMRDASLHAHPSAKGDPILMAFTGLAVQTFHRHTKASDTDDES